MYQLKSFFFFKIDDERLTIFFPKNKVYDKKLEKKLIEIPIIK
jgi:hypothetical protein